MSGVNKSIADSTKCLIEKYRNLFYQKNEIKKFRVKSIGNEIMIAIANIIIRGGFIFGEICLLHDYV